MRGGIVLWAPVVKLVASQPKKVGRSFRPRFWKVVTDGILGKRVVFCISASERR